MGHPGREPIGQRVHRVGGSGINGKHTHGIDQAKDLASGVASDVATAFSKEGLDGAAIKDTVTTAAQGVKSLLERSVDTALGADRSQTRTN